MKTKDVETDSSIYNESDYIHLLELELDEERRLRNQETLEYDILEQEYENIISLKNNELLKAKNKIIYQDQIISSYKEKYGRPIILEGDEHDLYKGEQKDFIRYIISNAMKNYDKHTRAYKICESILKANSEVGERKRIKELLCQIFKNYNGMNRDIISELNSIGINVEMDGRGHFKLTLANDDRYTVNISNSPSDSRCGLNVISDINKLFF